MGYTIATDPVGWMAALCKLEDEAETEHMIWTSGELNPTRHDTDNTYQLRTFYRHGETAESWGSSSHKLLVSSDHAALNHFIEESGGKGRFDPPFLFDDCVGIATTVEHQVSWRNAATRVNITGPEGTTYLGFEMSELNCEILNVGCHNEPVARLFTTDAKTSVWLTPMNEPFNERALLDMAVLLLETPGVAHTEYRGARVPMLGFNKQGNLDWMFGLQSVKHIIFAAHQQVRLHMNEFGTRVEETGSAFAIPNGAPAPLILDRPFLLFFAREGVPLPSCVCYIDIDIWQLSK